MLLAISNWSLPGRALSPSNMRVIQCLPGVLRMGFCSTRVVAPTIYFLDSSEEISEMLARRAGRRTDQQEFANVVAKPPAQAPGAMIHFPLSGVETPIWLPPLVALAISFFTSMGGVSGAFLLLPFQMSVLGFVSPAVTPTNLVFNLVAIPSGVYRYLREGRLLWPLTLVVVAGTVPGVALGVWVRLNYLPDPRPFKAFVGLVLIVIAVRMILDLRRGAETAARGNRVAATADESGSADWTVKLVAFNWRKLQFRFRGRDHRCNCPGVFGLAVLVGVIGGAYGIGGGALMAPIFVTVYRLPIHTVAGATLLETFVTSVAGVLFYQLAAPAYADLGQAVAPDWLLGGLFGLGGLVGMYLGARTQKKVPAGWIKALLVLILLFVSFRYLSAYLRS